MDNSLLRKVQLTQLEIFKQIQGIAQVHGIQVFMASGSLLGAVRHQGFIPWDDDLDLAVLRKDYDRLMKVLEDELPQTYWVQNYDTDEEYWQGFAKVRKRGTLYKEKALNVIDNSKCGIWVDIFPLDYTLHANGVQLKLRKFIVKTIGFSIKRRQLQLPLSNFSRRYIPILLFWKLFSLKNLKKIQIFFMKNVIRDETEYVANITSTYDIQRETYRTEWFSDAVKLPFEDVLCDVPAGYREVLTQLYGDFMTPPPEDKRGGHNMDEQSSIVI